MAILSRCGDVARRQARRLPAMILCALAAHTVLYRSLWPADGAHGYFTWYAPAVAVLATASIVVLPLAVASALTGAGTSRWLAVLAAPGRHQSSLTLETARLGGGALAVLLGQESIERSLQLHRLTPASVSLLGWVTVLVAIVAVSWAVAFACRAVSALAGSIGRRRFIRRVLEQVPRPARVVRSARPARPLAVHGGLRAPPLAL